MKICVFGITMEERGFSPAWTLKEIPEHQKTTFELILTRIIREELSLSVEIIGLPWVSTRGMGKPIGTFEEYLKQPPYLKRIIEVTFLAHGITSDLFIIGYNSQEISLVNIAKKWLDVHLDHSIDKEQIIWYKFEPAFSQIVTTDNVISCVIRDIPSLVELTNILATKKATRG